jgi:hypothetical protein
MLRYLLAGIRGMDFHTSNARTGPGACVAGGRKWPAA